MIADYFGTGYKWQYQERIDLSTSYSPDPSVSQSLRLPPSSTVRERPSGSGLRTHASFGLRRHVQ